MIGRIISQGRGIAGLARYLSHDRATTPGEKPETSERVAWTRTFGSPTDDVDLTIRIMQGTVADRNEIKARAGGPAVGRKLKTTYVHGLVSFDIGESPSIREQTDAVDGFLQAAGLEGCLAVAWAHTDTEALHIHVAACKVHPYTGRAATMSHGWQKLSTWARQWEEAHGGVRIQTRVKRAAERAEFRAAVDEEMAAFAPTNGTKREQARERAKARNQAKEKVLASAPPMTPRQPTRGAGRDDRTPEEKARWRALFADPEYLALGSKQQKVARKALRAELDAARAAAAGAAPPVPAEEPLPAEVPAPPPVPAEPVVHEPPSTPEQRAVMYARHTLAKWREGALPLRNSTLGGIAQDLRRSADRVDAVAADVLDDIAKRRSAADRERAEKEERELAIGAFEALLAALLEALRQICNHALGRADVPPEAKPVRPAPKTQVKREEETPSHWR